MPELSYAEHDGFKQFTRIYCISLKASTDRREHIQEEFARVGIGDYEFIDAFEKDSRDVHDLYHSDFVKKFPPCFRCGLDSCNCANKSLFRPQIGNWLSHMHAWRNISEIHQGLALVCEDDVSFQSYVHKSLQMLEQSQEIAEGLFAARPVLVRLGWAFCEEHELRDDPKLTHDIRMSNPCYAMNSVMAKLALNSLEEISTTSDVFLHRQLGSTVNHFTVMPPPAFELSWSTGDFVSEIRPKEKRLDYLMGKLKTLDPQDPEFEQTKASYEKEQSRLKQYDRYNKSPTLDYEDKYHLI